MSTSEFYLPMMIAQIPVKNFSHDKQEALMAEGPTGVGKSFAYMIPAMLKMLRRDATDAKRVVIATANIALQDQLYLKDMPFLTSVLPGCRNMKYMLVKGRSNYACLLKAEEIEDKRDELKEETKSAEYLLVPKDDNEDVLDPEVSELLEWLQHTTTGDKNELPKVYEKWGSISTSSEECLGSKCPYKNDCFTSRARRKMKVTPILITNYHFLLTSPDMVEDAVLICDEAHDLADIARDVLGWEMSRSTFSKSVSFVSKVCAKTAEFLKQHLNDLWMAIEDQIRSGKHSHLRIRSWNDTGFSLEKIISSGSGSRTGGFEGTYNKYINTWMLNDEFVVAARKVYCEGLPIAGDRDLMVSRIVKYKKQPLSEREKIITFAYLVDEHDEKTLRNLIDRLDIKIGKTTAFNQHIWKWRIMICVLGWEITDKFNMSPANARPYYSLDEMIVWIKDVISDDANCRDQVPVLIADYLLGEDNPRPFRYSTVVAALREMTHRDTKYCKYCKTCNVDNHCEYRLVTSKEDQ
jgi:Rad3-related DNA helicase